MMAHDAFSLGTAAFVDEDFTTALSHFEAAIREQGESAKGDVFIKKAATLLKLGKQSDAKDALIEAHKRGDFNQSVWTSLAAKAGLEDIPSVSVSQPTAGQTVAAPIPAAASFLPPAKIRHEWFQNENFVTISVFIKGLPKDDPNVVQIQYQEKVLSVTVKLPNGSDYMLELDPLFSEISPEDCKHSIMSTKIEIKLKKKIIGIKWADLEGSHESAGPLQTILAASATAPPAYPSSSKKKHDWDSLVKNHEEEKPEGEAALHALFKNIYKDASEDTRRAMMKSFQESGGTVLSTNWEEIGKKKVEVSPPDGMVAKKYEH